MTQPTTERAQAPHGRAGESGATSPLVVLLGNPNTGKTTLFNRLTGQNARIGNYPGVTVERRSGSSRLDGNRQVEVVDLVLDLQLRGARGPPVERVGAGPRM